MPQQPTNGNGSTWTVAVVLADGFDFTLTTSTLYDIPQAIQTYKHTKLDVAHQNMGIASFVARQNN